MQIKVALILVLALSYALSTELTRGDKRRAQRQYQKYIGKADRSLHSGFTVQAIDQGSVTLNAPSQTAGTVHEDDDVSYSVSLSGLAANQGVMITWDSDLFDFTAGWAREDDGEVKGVYASSFSTSLKIPACGCVGHTTLYLQISYFPLSNDPASATVTFGVNSFDQTCEEFPLTNLDTLVANITTGTPRYYKLQYAVTMGQTIQMSVSPSFDVNVEASANPLVYPVSPLGSSATVLALNAANTIIISLESTTDVEFTLTFTTTPYNCSTRLAYGDECGENEPPTAVCPNPICPLTANYSNALIDPSAEFGLAFLYAFGGLFLPRSCFLATMDAACINAYAPCDANNLLRTICALPYCNTLQRTCSGVPGVTPSECAASLESSPDSPSSIIPYDTTVTDVSTIDNDDPLAICVYYAQSAGMRSSVGAAILAVMAIVMMVL